MDFEASRSRDPQAKVRRDQMVAPGTRDPGTCGKQGIPTRVAAPSTQRVPDDDAATKKGAKTETGTDGGLRRRKRINRDL